MICDIVKKYCVFILVIISNIVSAQKVDTGFIKIDSVFVQSRNIKILEIKNPFVVNNISQQQMLNKGARSTPEAMIGVGGVFIQKTNHGGGSPFIRGLTGNQSLLMIDGIRLNNATFRYGPNQYLNTIDLFTIDKIDVLKGIGAVEYGSDAMGGVINIKTKENTLKEFNKISLSNTSKFISSRMEKTNRTDVQYARKLWNFIGGISLKKYDDLVGGGNIGKQIPTGYDEINYDFKTKMKITSKSEIIYSSQNTIQKNVPIYHKIVLENYKTNQIDYQIHYLNYLKYKYIRHKKWISELIINASTQQTIEQRSNQKNNSFIYRNEADTIKNIGLTGEIISNPFPNWTVNTGFDYYKDQVLSSAVETNVSQNIQSNKRGLYPNGAVYKNSSFFNTHYLNLGSLNLIAGVRYNYLNIKLKDITLGDVEVKPSALISNVGFNFQILNHHYLFGSITTGYRAPNIDDMGSLGIVDFRYEIPSYDLKPEKSKNTEFGYKHKSNKSNFSIIAFHMKLNDLIARMQVPGQVINGYNVYNKKNIESSYIYGGEMALSYAINDNFTWSNNATYTYGQNISKNEPMRRIPPFFGQNKFTWNYQNKSIVITHEYAGKQTRLAQGDKDDNRIGILGTPAWSVFNIDAGWQLKYVYLQANLLNLFDKAYKTHGSGVYGIGRAVNLTIQWKIL